MCAGWNRANAADYSDQVAARPPLLLLAAIDWAGADAAERAAARVRRRALAYVEAYQQRGQDAAFVYRDREPPVAAAHEFADMVTRGARAHRRSGVVRATRERAEGR